MASTCDSAESIATPPPESDLDDEQIRALLSSALYLQEGEANADRSQDDHSFRENFVPSSSHFQESAGKLVAKECTGKPVALFSNKMKSSQEALSDREDFPLEHQQVLGNNEPLFRLSNLENLAKSFLEEHKD